MSENDNLLPLSRNSNCSQGARPQGSSECDGKNFQSSCPTFYILHWLTGLGFSGGMSHRWNCGGETVLETGDECIQAIQSFITNQIGNDCGVDPRFRWTERMKIEYWELPREIEHYPLGCFEKVCRGMGWNGMSWKWKGK